MVNKVILVGNLGKDPEVRYLPNGSPVAQLSVATSRSWVDKQSSQRKEETEWHSVEVWGKQAEACGEYLAKGRSVYVEGRIKTEKWQDKQTGADKYRVKIVAENVRFLGGGQGKAAKPAAAPGTEGETPPAGFSGPEDIPF